MATSASIRLITAKTSRPPVGRRFVRRRRLAEKLSSGLDQPLSLVCAGAGFGKTSLVSAWLDELAEDEQQAQAIRAAWLTLDKQDSNLNLFMRYLTAAVQNVAPGACSETIDLLGSRLRPPLAHLVATFCNEMTRLPGKTLIVLDDYNTIQGTAVPDYLNELLQHQPENLHLVLISRHTPPLPVARLRARGHFTEIRNHDLRFTPAEVAEFVHLALPDALSQPDLELLERKTEGWAAGLQLVMLSLLEADSVAGALASVSGESAHLAEYFLDEVLARQPQAVQNFMLQTAVLDQFSASLAQAVVIAEDPEWDAGTTLASMARNNVFVTPLDDRGKWYRYHPLLRELLQDRLLAQTDPEQVSNLHRKAAGWHAQRGFLGRAVNHALQANEVEYAASLMEQGLPDVLNREDRSTLEMWWHMLPEEFMISRPGLLVIKAWSLVLAWQIPAMGKVVQDVERLVEQSQAGAGIAGHLAGQIAALKCVEAFCRGHLELSITEGRKALDLLPDTWIYARGGILNFLTLSMQCRGEGAAAERMLLESYESQRDKTGVYALRLLLSLALAYLQEGRLQAAEEVSDFMLHHATRNQAPIIQGWAHFILGAVHYYWNNLERAGRHFGELVERRYQVQALAARQGAIGLALVHQASERSTQAWEVLQLLSQFDLELDGRPNDVTQALRARILLAAGKGQEAARWAESYTFPVAQIVLLLLELPQLTRAQLILAGNRSRDGGLRALAILDELLAVATSNHNARRILEIQATRALALDFLNRAAEARSALGQAVELSQESGMVRTFVDLGPRMQQMLAGLATQSTDAESVGRILAAYPTAGQNGRDRTSGGPQPSLPGAPSAGEPPLVESLTARERQVLRLLREPLSIKEIAVGLNISYATAKRHTINLYGKLDVNSRWDAVARAEALGILAPR